MILIILLLLFAPVAYSAEDCVTIPADKVSKAVEAFTDDGAYCNQGEATNACARRRHVELVENFVKRYWNNKNRNAVAEEPALGVS